MTYQDKQLKKEFITVDNRTIPFGYPQFWGGDDWEVSGRDNPLPVANYTRNEQGLWVPVSNENPVPTQLTGSNVEEIKLTPTTIVIPSGATSYIGDPVSVKDCRYFSIGIADGTLYENEYEIGYRHVSSSGTRLDGSSTTIGKTVYRMVTDRHAVKSPYVHFQIKNNNDIDINFTFIYLYKFM